MPRVQSIETAEKYSISHLASAARQSASYPELPFKGMEGPRDPFLVSVAINVFEFFPRAEWIRVKRLSNGRIIISVKAAGMKAHAKGYGHVNAQFNLIQQVFLLPKLWKAIYC
ncbi:MAG: hypothetical protein IKW27_06750 [Bacteroidales bacterium]|nr:hypothetical protein [Bacteroidales bacterium]